MQTRHRELNIYTITCMIMRWINLCIAREKTLDPFQLPAQALTLRASFTSTSDYDWLWTNSDRQTKHENHEKGLLQSTPWLLFTHRDLFKPESVLSGPQGRMILSIIRTQRYAFVRWIINKYPKSLHLQFNYTYNQRRFGSREEMLFYRSD